MQMHNPPHPGGLFLEVILPELKLSISQLAAHLHLPRQSVSRVINGHASIKADLAVRLESAGIGTARVWLAAQADYDLWQAQHRKHPSVHSLR